MMLMLPLLHNSYFTVASPPYRKGIRRLTNVYKNPTTSTMLLVASSFFFFVFALAVLVLLVVSLGRNLPHRSLHRRLIPLLHRSILPPE